MPLDLLINTADPQQRGLITSIAGGGIAPFPNFTRNDASVAITIQPVKPSTTDTRSFDVDYTTGDTYQVSIGSADEAPTAGTFALEIDGVTTDLTSLDFDISAEDLEDVLSAASVAGGNPALNVTRLSEGVYQVDGATNGVIPTIAATATNLIPNCSAVVTVITQGTVSTKGQQIIGLVQQPAAYAAPSTALPAASVSVSTEQAASSTANKIVRITFAAGTYGGLYNISATVGSVTASCGSVSPLASIGELSQVLAKHPSLHYNSATAANNFTVSTDGADFLVEFNGNLAGPSDPSLSVSDISLLAPKGASGTISLNTVNMAKMFWASGATSLSLTLSVVRTRTSGEVKTILSIPVTVPADIINAGSLTPISVQGAVRYDISQSLSAAEKLQAVTNQGLNLTASKLLGQASSGGTGLPVPISLGTNLIMSGTTLSAQGDRYLTSSTTSLTISNGTKSLTVGTGLAYTTQQDIVIAYDANNHMHATVTSYNSGTGAMVVDVQGKTGSGTYAVWTVNVGGIAAGVIPAGGSTGQVLNKISGADYDVQWGPTVTGTGTLALSTYTLTVAGTASVSGTNTGDQTSVSGNAGTATALATGRTLAITGDLTWTSPSFNGSANVTAAGTLATVNSNVGSFGSATQVATFTVNGKGLITAAGNTTITPSVGSITGLGTGVGTFLATPSSANLRAAVTDETGAGALVFATSPTLVTPALGTPSSGTLTSCIGLPISTGVSGLGTGVATANLVRDIFATTATAGGTTTLTATSAQTQEFTGSTTQDVTMPVVITLVAGWQTTFINKSTGAVTIYSSGSDQIIKLGGGQSVKLVCRSTSADTTPAAWDIADKDSVVFLSGGVCPLGTEGNAYLTYNSNFAARLNRATDLRKGWNVWVKNDSDYVCDIQIGDIGHSLLTKLFPQQSARIVCVDNSTDVLASWDVSDANPATEFTATLASSQSVADSIEETLIFQGAVGPLASALNGSTGVFTAPKAGTVLLSGVIQAYVGNSSSLNFFGNAYYRKNGASLTELGFFATMIPGSGSYTGGMTIPFSLPVSVSAGDTLEVSISLSDEASSGSLSAEANSSWTVKYLTP